MVTEVHARWDSGRRAFVPTDSAQLELMDEQFRHGHEYRLEVVKSRNSLFHRKAMALLRYVFGLWEPPVRTYQGKVVVPNFEAFRSELLCLSGHCTATYSLKHGVRLTPKSIAFRSCDEVEFQGVYSRLIDAALANVPALKSMSPDELDVAVLRILHFAD